MLVYLGECIGRDTLVQVTKEVSKSGEWKMLSAEEEELLDHMQDIKDSKAAKKVTGKEAAVDMENTCLQFSLRFGFPLQEFTLNINTLQLLGLEKRTGCNIM